MASNHARTRLTSVWVAHAIELIEETGSLEDEHAMAQAFSKHKDTHERLLERAWVLGQRLGLDREIERWRILQWPVGMAFCFIAYMTSGGLFKPFAGTDHSINLVAALATTLAVPTAIFGLWLVAVIRQIFTAGSTGSFLSGKAFWALLAWIPFGRNVHAQFLARGAIAMLETNRLATWFFGLMSHALWSTVLIFVPVMLWFHIRFGEYSLNWVTTDGSQGYFNDLVRITGQLPALLGFSFPTSVPLNSTPSTEQVMASTSWLIGCIITYGLMPRLVALAGCWWILQARKDRVQLDASDPYFQSLLVRFHAMEPSYSEDLETSTLERSSPAPRAYVPVQRLALALIGFELSHEHQWPPLHLGEQANLVRQVTGSFDERRTVLNELAGTSPYQTLVVCDLASSPDRGTERFLREICGYSEHGAILLTSPNRSSQVNTLRWSRWIESLELKNMTCLETEAAAYHWLNRSNG